MSISSIRSARHQLVDALTLNPTGDAVLVSCSCGWTSEAAFLGGDAQQEAAARVAATRMGHKHIARNVKAVDQL